MLRYWLKEQRQHILISLTTANIGWRCFSLSWHSWNGCRQPKINYWKTDTCSNRVWTKGRRERQQNKAIYPTCKWRGEGGGYCPLPSWVNNLVTTCRFLRSKPLIIARFFRRIHHFRRAQQPILPKNVNVNFSAINHPHFCNHLHVLNCHTE